jgi:ABC-2 type transport system permease protein
VADRNLISNEVDLVLRIPNGFGEDLARNRQADVQLIFDGTNGPTAGIGQSYSLQVIHRFVENEQARLRPRVTTASAAPAPRLEVRTRMWYNPGREFEDYMAPGILVILITIVGTMITALNIAREKEQGTIEQLNVTPITKGQFITGKLAPFWLLGIVEFGFGLFVAWLIYDIPLEGSLLIVFVGAGLYLVTALALGLLISTVSQTQQQAQFIAFFVLMIYLFISGLFTPVESMPVWAQWIAEANPIKHLIALIRAVLIKGAGVSQVSVELGMLAAFATITLPLAVRTYSKTAA